MTGPKQDSRLHSAESFAAQAPLAALALAAIAVIALINANAQPARAVAPQLIAAACADCGTVVAVHQSAHSSPVYFVQLQMRDGSTRVVQQLAAGFRVGDIVEVNGNALSLRPHAS